MSFEIEKEKTLKDVSITEIEKAIGAAVGALIDNKAKARITLLRDAENPGTAALIGSRRFQLELDLTIGESGFSLFDEDEKQS